ncbi:MAG: hypothetical protein ACLTDF_07955 [Coprococcus sp.]
MRRSYGRRMIALRHSLWHVRIVQSDIAVGGLQVLAASHRMRHSDAGSREWGILCHLAAQMMPDQYGRIYCYHNGDIR